MKSSTTTLARRNVILTFLLTFAAICASQVRAQLLTSAYDFTLAGGATKPIGGVAVSGNKLYGTTTGSGTNGYGAVYAVNNDGTGFTVLHTFTGGTNGGAPWAGLLLAGNTLFGTTTQNGSAGGTVFSVNTDGTGFAILHTFPTNNPATNLVSGAVGGLVLAGTNLYGTMDAGSTGGDLIFSIGTNGANFTVLHTFSGTDGARITSTLALSGATLYGTAEQGGQANFGAVFAINTSGAGFTNLYSFTNGTDGAYPWAGVTVSGGVLYGTATAGGGTGDGTIFAINAGGGGFSTLHIFSGTDGAQPYGGLLLSSNVLYGLAEVGGESGSGSLFEININGSGFSTLYNFANASDGGNPQDTLTLSGSTLYGTTTSALTGNGYGSVFAFSLAPLSTLAGNLQVTLWPPQVTNAGALWQVDGGGAQVSGAIITNISDGSHIVTFLPADGWVAPDDQFITITNGTLEAEGFYTPVPNGAPGSLTVTLLPPDAVAAGAEWEVDGGPPTLSGTTVTNLAAGAHTISFTTIPGWLTPLNQAVTIIPRATVAAPGVYSPIVNGPSGGLTVQLVPDDAVRAGAQWSIDGGLAQPTGTIVTNLAVGPHTLSFRSISGWNTPEPQIVTINDGATTPAIGRYLVGSVAGDGVVLITNGPGRIEHVSWSKDLTAGRKYTVRAVPDRGAVFSNWTGGESLPALVLGTNPVYAFYMQSNLVLQANFAGNAFNTAKGKYRGLFAPEFSARLQNNSGSFLFDVSATGGISGNLSLGGTNVPLSGKFNQQGFATVTTKRPSGAIVTILQLDFTNQTVTGIVSNESFSAALMGNQDVFSRSNQATAYEGQYSVVISGSTNASIGPFGYSYGIVTVDGLGNVKLTGSLADGTSVSESTVVSATGYWPLYIKLYNGRGSLWGWNSFGNRTLASSPTLSWINGSNSANAALYRSGFTNQAATLTGGVYVSNYAFQSGLPITLAGGGLAAPIVATNPLQDPSLLTLQTNIKTGIVSGSFANPADPNQAIHFNGVIVDGLGEAAGYFLGTNQSGSFVLGPR